MKILRSITKQNVDNDVIFDMDNNLVDMYSNNEYISELGNVYANLDCFSEQHKEYTHNLEKVMLKADISLNNNQNYTIKEKNLIAKGMAWIVDELSKALTDKTYKFDKETLMWIDPEQYQKDIGYTELELLDMLDKQIEESGFVRTKYSDDFEGVLKNRNIILYYDLIVENKLAPIINRISKECIKTKDKMLKLFEHNYNKKFIEGTKEYDNIIKIIDNSLLIDIVEPLIELCLM